MRQIIKLDEDINHILNANIIDFYNIQRILKKSAKIQRFTYFQVIINIQYAVLPKRSVFRERMEKFLQTEQLSSQKKIKYWIQAWKEPLKITKIYKNNYKKKNYK